MVRDSFSLDGLVDDELASDEIIASACVADNTDETDGAGAETEGAGAETEGAFEDFPEKPNNPESFEIRDSFSTLRLTTMRASALSFFSASSLLAALTVFLTSFPVVASIATYLYTFPPSSNFCTPTVPPLLNPNAFIALSLTT